MKRYQQGGRHATATNLLGDGPAIYSQAAKPGNNQDKPRLPAGESQAQAGVLRPQDGLIGGVYLDFGNIITALGKNTRKYRKFKFLLL